MQLYFCRKKQKYRKNLNCKKCWNKNILQKNRNIGFRERSEETKIKCKLNEGCEVKYKVSKQTYYCVNMTAQ